MHARVSGVADYLAEDDKDALEIARRIVSTLNRRPAPSNPEKPPRDPEYPASELYGIVSRDMRYPYDVREVIVRLVDGSEFDEFKPHFGSTLVCGFAHLHGYSIGIVANNGILFSESALKGAHFIQVCNRRETPLLFLQNTMGFMVGSQVERGGIAKDGAKLVTAVSCARVPKFTVIIGGSFGAGNYGMCGRAYDPRMLWMWPNARISVMGGEQAAMVLTTVRRQSLEARGEKWSEQDEQQFRQQTLAEYERQGHPYYASARLWDDGVIDPIDTRRVIGLGLAAARNTSIGDEQPFGVFRM
jgi:3-methylcrotonyl-CoA carboxylase beta subunit